MTGTLVSSVRIETRQSQLGHLSGNSHSKLLCTSLQMAFKSFGFGSSKHTLASAKICDYRIQERVMSELQS